MLPQLMGTADKTNDFKNFELASKNPAYAAFLEKQKSDSEKFGLSPMYGVDANGNPVAVQLSSKGGGQPVQLPEGVTISKTPIKMDTGTEIEFLDPVTRQVVRRVPKDLAGAEAAKAKGKIQGQVQAALPGDISNADQTVTQIDKLLKNEGLSQIVGPLDQFRPSWMMSDSGRDALARYNQLKGKAFLQAYGMLRGGGQITEVEGQKAQDAMARMDRAQGEDDFKAALGDFRDAVRTGLQKLKEKAGVGATQGQTAGGVSWSVE
jgi:flagellar protein FlgJ